MKGHGWGPWVCTEEDTLVVADMFVTFLSL